MWNNLNGFGATGTMQVGTNTGIAGLAIEF